MIYTFPLEFWEETVTFLRLSKSENPCVPVLISTPASSLIPGACHPHTLPASTLRDIGTTQHRGPEFMWVLYFF